MMSISSTVTLIRSRRVFLGAGIGDSWEQASPCGEAHFSWARSCPAIPQNELCAEHKT